MENSAIGQETKNNPRCQGKGVQIAVLDTWPMGREPDPLHPLDHIRSFRRRLHLRGIYNPRIDDAAEGRIAAEYRIHDYVTGSSFEHDPCFGHDQATQTFRPPYRMADHGLVVASIIHDIAPDAEISVHRVLNDFGTTDLDTVANAIRVAVARAEARDEPLIINLSLGFASMLEMVVRVLANAEGFRDDPASFRQELVNLGPFTWNANRSQQVIDSLQARGLIQIIDGTIRFRRELWALDQLFGFDVANDRVLLVAASGNDSGGGQTFGPRLPAAIEGVIGVGATNRAFNQVAPYSNAPDLLTTNAAINLIDDGVTAFGGEVDGTGVSLRAVVGPYTAPFYPAANGGPGGVNDTGWTEWSGTSFSAPIVAGYAASIWCKKPSATSQDVLDSVCRAPAAGGGGAGAAAAGGTHRGVVRLRQRFDP